MLHFSDDACVVQSKEGLPGSSRLPQAHHLEIGKDTTFRLGGWIGLLETPKTTQGQGWRVNE